MYIYYFTYIHAFFKPPPAETTSLQVRHDIPGP